MNFIVLVMVAHKPDRVLQIHLVFKHLLIMSLEFHRNLHVHNMYVGCGLHEYVCAYRFFFIAAALCVDTIPSGGYECVPRPNVTSVLIVSGLKNDPGFLDDFLQSYLEKLLVSHGQ